MSLRTLLDQIKMALPTTNNFTHFCIFKQGLLGASLATGVIMVIQFKSFFRGVDLHNNW